MARGTCSDKGLELPRSYLHFIVAFSRFLLSASPTAEFPVGQRVQLPTPARDWLTYSTRGVFSASTPLMLN